MHKAPAKLPSFAGKKIFQKGLGNSSVLRLEFFFSKYDYLYSSVKANGLDFEDFN